MKILTPTPESLDRMVRSFYAVVTADGTIDANDLEVQSIDAAQRHMLSQATPLAFGRTSLPGDLALVITDAATRRQLVRMMAIMAMVGGKMDVAKVAVVERAASVLDQGEFGITMLGHVARGKARKVGFAIMKRLLAHYWSPTGKVRHQEWLAVIWSVMPWLPGLHRYLGLDRVLSRYRGLADLAPDSFGAAVLGYYTSKGFPVPGERKSIPEGWARHEIYHVLANYNTNLQGELLLAGFIAGNTEELCLDLVLPALAHLHVGFKFVPGPLTSGLLLPDEFFRAVARGARMRIDLLDGWSLWADAPKGLEEVRAAYAIPPLDAEEVTRLTPHKALLVA